MKRYPWHSVFIMLYSVLFLFSENITLVKTADIWLPLGIVFSGSIGFFILSYLLLRNGIKAGIASTVAIMLFFGYGHYHDFFYLPNKEILSIRFKYDLYIWGSIAICLSSFIILYRLKSTPIKLNSIFNFMGGLLLLMPLYTIGTYSLSKPTTVHTTHTSTAVDSLIPVNTAPQTQPSIYYLIMDAYGRNDVLQEYYGYDNTAFTNYLEETGFFVADKSFANYNKTVLSVPSSLNMMYLDSLSAAVGRQYQSQEPLLNLIYTNKTQTLLKRFGYSSVAFDAQILDYLFLNSADTFYNTPGVSLNMFQTELYNLSIMQAFAKRRALSFYTGEFKHHRKKILTGFDRIIETSKENGPFYVHGHILSPHQPFVFDENGDAVEPHHHYTTWYPIEEGRDPDEYRKEYIAQLQFINKKLIVTVNAILKNSKVPPIIIIQGDHGPCAELTNTETIAGNNFKERMPILNAYYFPDQNYAALYPGISPVNSFRQIFSQYFNLDYPLLADSSYYSTWTHDYAFVNVTDSISRIP